MIQVLPIACSGVGFVNAVHWHSVIAGEPSTSFISENRAHPWSSDGTFRNLALYSGNNTVRPDWVDVTLYVNGSPTDLITRLNEGNAYAANIDDEAVVNAGDLIVYRVESSEGVGFGGYELGICVDFEGDRQCFGITADAGGASNGNGWFGGAFGNGICTVYAVTTHPEFISNNFSICAANGNVTRLDLYAHSGEPGADAWIGWMKVDGIIQDGAGGTVDTTCTMTGATQSAFSTFTLPVSLGQRIEIVIMRSGATIGFANAHVSGSCGFEPTTPGQFMLCGGSGDAIDEDVTSWKWNHSLQLAPDEFQHTTTVGPTGLRAIGIYIYRTGAVGTSGDGSGYRHTLRRNGVDTGIEVTLESFQSGGVFYFNVIFSPEDLITIQVDPIGSPAPRALYWGLIADFGAEEGSEDFGTIGPIAWVEEWPQGLGS